MKVTLIFTVLDEEKSLPALLDSIAVQTRQPDEVIVCDGGSRDCTVDILRNEKRYNIHVIEVPGANISRGRNVAIAAASNELIACTDAGVRLDPEWLDKLVEPFWIAGCGLRIESHPQSKIEYPKCVAGFFHPDPQSTFEIAMSATVLPDLRDIQPEKFLPSSRSVAYLKSAWQEVGGYPEWLDYCEDAVFDLKMRERCGGRGLIFAPEAVAHFRPRPSLRAFFRQYYLYARGDGKANLFFKRHLIRNVTYLVALPILLVGIVLGTPAIKLLCTLALIAGVVIYTRKPYRRLSKLARERDLPAFEKLKVVALVPVIRVVGDVAKMFGYPVGVRWRMKNRQAIEKG